jgi:phosphoribosylaminoimidazole (AIR) synthetase
MQLSDILQPTMKQDRRTLEGNTLWTIINFWEVIKSNKSIATEFKMGIFNCGIDPPLCVRDEVLKEIVQKTANAFANAASKDHKENKMKKHTAYKNCLKFRQCFKGNLGEGVPVIPAACRTMYNTEKYDLSGFVLPDSIDSSSSSESESGDCKL